MESAATSLDREVAGRDVGIEGEVRLTAPAGMVPLIAPVLTELRNDHPRLTFHLQTDVASLNLLKGETDIAIRAAHTGQPSLIARRIGHSPWTVFASKVYLRRRGTPLPDLAGHAVVGFDDSLARTPGGVWLAENASKATVVLRTNNVLSALDCAAAHLGLVTAPLFLAARYAALERLFRPLVIDAGSLFLVTHRDLAKVPRIRATLDAIAAELRKQAAIIQGHDRGGTVAR